MKMNRNTAATIPGPVPPTDVTAARTTIDRDIPTAPINIKGRRPTFSMVKTAIQDAKKYSVPLQAAKIRERKPDRPISCS